MSGRSEFVAALVAGTIAREGSPITVGTRTVPAQVRLLERREREYLPEGVRNVADADLRSFTVAVAGFPVWPAIGETITWHGQDYILAAVRPDDLSGEAITLGLVAHRTPPQGSDSLDPATGKRPDYLPPDTTL